MSLRTVKGVLPLILAGGIAASLCAATPAFAQGTTAPAPAKKPEPVKPATAPAPAAAGKAAPAQPSTATKQAESGVADAKPPTDPAAAAEPEKESNRAIYLSADLGFQRVDIGGLTDNTGFDKTGANGLLAGLGIGYRYKEFRLGGRFRTSSTTEYSLWQVMGEIGWGLPLRPISPVFMVHGGYVFDVGVERSTIASSLPPSNILTPDVDLNGAMVGGEVSAPFYFTKFLRVGPFVSADVLFLHRSTVSTPQSLFPTSDQTRSNALFNDSGSGTGYAIAIGIRGTGDISF